ncbi:MAG: HAD-IIA family hydrolase [Anaerolineales bacterium]|jgi:4-nitrophenyl phosphatase
MSPKTKMNIKGLIFDMDGVIWKGNQPLADLPNIFSKLHNRGYRIILATNNTTLSIDNFHKKLNKFGVILENWQVINSSLATAIYLQRLFPDGGPVHILGEEGLIATMREFNFYHQQKDVLAVVVGLDRKVTYEKLKQASFAIQSGVPFIGTNPDPSLPTPEGLIPGTGTMLAALEAASGLGPKCIGKPEPELYNLALSRLNTKPKETLVIGDRLETDIAGGQNIGCATCAVLTGVASENDAYNWKPKIDFILNNISEILDIV